MNRFTLFIFILFFAGLTSQVTYADDDFERLNFDVPTNIAPLSGLGLVMSEQGTKTFSSVEVSQTSPGIVRATFLVPKEAVIDGALASVAVFSSDGNVAFSTVKSIHSLQMAILPSCPVKEAVALTDQNQVGVLQSLVSIRGSRRDTVKAKVAKQLTAEYVERLSKLEKGFGLSPLPPLSSELTPLELIDRLTRILNAVKNYRSNKK